MKSEIVSEDPSKQLAFQKLKVIAAIYSKKIFIMLEMLHSDNQTKTFK